MESENNSESRKRILIGILIGIILLIVTGGIYALAIFFVSILVFACMQSPPDWVYMIVFVGFPIPMIISSIVIPYQFFKKKKWAWMILCFFLGLFFSALIYLIWFLIMSQYC